MGYISSRSILIQCQSCLAEKRVFQLVMATVRFTRTIKFTPKKCIFLFPLPEVKSLGFRLHRSLE